MSAGAATFEAGVLIAALRRGEIDDDGIAQHDADERPALPLERAELERHGALAEDVGPGDKHGSGRKGLHRRVMTVSSVVSQTRQRILREHTPNRHITGSKRDAHQRQRRQRHRRRIARA